MVRKIFSLLLTLTVISLAQNYNPVANEKAIVKEGNARFTVLNPRLIRMEWSDNEKFEDHASLTFVNRNLPVPKFTKAVSGNVLEIKTDELFLKYKLNSGKFTKDNLSIEYKLGGETKTWKFGDENKGNLKGTTRTLDGMDGDYNVYAKKKIELEDGIISRDGWFLVDDSERPLFDNSDYPWVIVRPSLQNQDFYFFGYGYNYKQALKDFTTIAGKISLPPKFVFGYWYSRYWPYTDKEMRELVTTFESLNIPLDVLIVDMDWHKTSLPEFFKEGKRIKDQAGQAIGWTGFSWDKNIFPFPEDFLKWKTNKGLKTCLNIHPASGIQPHEDAYPEMAKAVGIDPSTKQYVPFNITDKNWAKNYFDIILHPMEKMGIDFWWLDWQQWGSTNITGVNPTFYLNYVHFSDMERQNKVRPLIYHRWGGLGNHRYQIGFSGDTYITWASLNYQPYFTSTSSNVGWGYWGHDIGGHFGNTDNDPELLTRWFQFGAFSPILKSHATHEEKIKRKIWEYPAENFFIMRDVINLRYSLIPYIYTNARKAYDESISLCRPLYYEYPQKEEAYSIKNEYFFGDDMIVNPVTKPIGKDSLFIWQSSWLPEGKWFEWATGTILEGNRVINRKFRLDEIPVYIKEGAIIPMAPQIKNTSENKVDPLILNIFPGSEGSTKIYDDEGNNQNFKSGKYSFTKVHFFKKNNKVTVTIEPIEGNYPGMLSSRTYEVRLLQAFPAKEVKVNGKILQKGMDIKEKGWVYDGEELSVRLKTSKLNIHNRTTIEIILSDENTELLNGKMGKFKHLFAFTKFLAGKRTFWAQNIWNDALMPSGVIIRASQAGYLLSMHPENAVTELKGFDVSYSKTIEMLKEISNTNKDFKPYYDLLNE
jgi:alpha-glucosidase (family GH31 glycosyl hydrolase)